MTCDQAGPYEAQVWYDPKRDRLLVKFRTTNEVGENKGVVFWLHEEDVQKLMERRLPGMEYPTHQVITTTRS